MLTMSLDEFKEWIRIRGMSPARMYTPWTEEMEIVRLENEIKRVLLRRDTVENRMNIWVTERHRPCKEDWVHVSWVTEPLGMSESEIAVFCQENKIRMRANKYVYPGGTTYHWNEVLWCDRLEILTIKNTAEYRWELARLTKLKEEKLDGR
jgi:hypothetical protein